MVTQGNKNQLFSVAKAILTVFFLFWNADYKFVLIFVVEGKVLELYVFIYIKYPYNAFKTNWIYFQCGLKTKGYNHDVIN